MTEILALAAAAAVPIAKIVEVIRSALGSRAAGLPSWVWAVLAMAIGAGIAFGAQIDVKAIPASADPSVLRILVGAVAGAFGSTVHHTEALIRSRAGTSAGGGGSYTVTAAAAGAGRKGRR